MYVYDFVPEVGLGEVNTINYCIGHISSFKIGAQSISLGQDSLLHMQVHGHNMSAAAAETANLCLTYAYQIDTPS